MSDDIQKLEERLNSKLNLQFELYNQGMTLLRDNVSRRFELQDQQMQQAVNGVVAVLQTALAAQRQIVEDSLAQHQQLTQKSLSEIRSALQEAISDLDQRVARLEGQAPTG